MAVLSQPQVERLLRPPHPSKIDKVQGQSYLPHYEVRAELLRTFGPGNFDHQTTHAELVYEVEEQGDKGLRWRVCYRVAVRLNIRDLAGEHVATFEEWHADETIHPNRGEAHANAITSAQSVALRRACISLGDSLGLTLYNDGSVAALTKGTLLHDLIPTATKTPEQAGTLAHSLGVESPEVDDASHGVKSESVPS